MREHNGRFPGLLQARQQRFWELIYHRWRRQKGVEFSSKSGDAAGPLIDTCNVRRTSESPLVGFGLLAVLLIAQDTHTEAPVRSVLQQDIAADVVVCWLAVPLESDDNVHLLGGCAASVVRFLKELVEATLQFLLGNVRIHGRWHAL